MDKEIIEASEAASLAVPAVPPYSLVPLPSVNDQALAVFKESAPLVQLTEDEREIDERPLLNAESDYTHERREVLRAALPKYEQHYQAVRHRIRVLKELVPPSETIPPVSICKGWMGATAQQAKQLNAQLEDIFRRREQRVANIEHRFQQTMHDRLKEKSRLIIPPDLATVRRALYEYEQTESPNAALLEELREQYAMRLDDYCLDILTADGGMVFTLICRLCGLPMEHYHFDKDSEGWPGLYCRSAHEQAFVEAYLKDHPRDRADFDPEWGLDGTTERSYSVVKGTGWGVQCYSCGGYFQIGAHVPENFPARRWRVCSWNCLVFRAQIDPGNGLTPFADFIDPELSRGSEWWNLISATTFPPSSFAEAVKREEKKQPKKATALVVVEPSVASASPMAERILSVLRGLASGQVIEDRPLRKAVGVTSTEVRAYVRERDRLIDAQVIGCSGTGHRGSPFKFWYQGEAEPE